MAGTKFMTKIALCAVAMAAVVGGALVALPDGPNLDNPFRGETTERDHSALLVSLRDVRKFQAASGQYQVVVDIEKDTKYVPSWVSGERVVFMAEGEVEAVVDFSRIASGAVDVASDDKTTITLPQPTLSEPRIDPDNSEVISKDRGVANRVGDALSDGEGKEKALYQSAAAKISDAADKSDLVATAETNTRGMLTGLLGDLGYDDVTVTFEPAPTP